jgi:uncharacterized protein YjiK
MCRWLAIALVAFGCGGGCGCAAGGESGRGGSGDGGTRDSGTGDAGGVAAFGFAPTGPPIALRGVTNTSDITWKPATDTFFVVANSVVHEYSSDFSARLRTIRIGGETLDAEGITYLGEVGPWDRFALAVEAPTDVVLSFDLAPDATVVDAASVRTYVLAPAPPLTNKGWEGVAYRPAKAGGAAWLYACREGEPGQVAMRVIRFPYRADDPAAATWSYADGSLAVDEPWDALARLGDVAEDLSGLHYDTSNDTLLVLSQIGSRLLRVDPATGTVVAQLVLDRSPQYEGVTLASEDRLVLVSEPNFVEIFRRSAR